MRIVLDTNVFISGIFWEGKPSKVLRQWSLNKLEVLLTEKIFIEYVRVLKEITNDKKLLAKWTSFVTSNSIFVEESEIIKICRDPDDDKFLNCAVIGEADYLVTGDKDLLVLQAIGNTKIVNPNTFIVSTDREE